MIFKQVDEILSGQKTQTRRVVKPGEQPIRQFVGGPADDQISGVVYQVTRPPRVRIRVKWSIGKPYAVVPKRGLPGVWWRPVDGGVELLHEHPEWPAFREGLNTSRATWRLALENLKARGFRPLRIRITAIRQERLQDITEDDAKAEGVSSKGEYAKLWNRINKRKGTRWSDNPMVWVISFEVAK